MDRVETLNYLKDKSDKKERIVVSRYNDGEYLLMNKLNTKAIAHQTSNEIIGPLLIRSIKVKEQFVCINYLKPHNIKEKDIWYLTQEYLAKEGGHELYGCSHWIDYDFRNNNILLPKIFLGKVLLVAGLAEEASNFFRKIQPKMRFYKTASDDSVNEYDSISRHVENICNNYETILFSCGPIAKVLVADFINKCSCNLIDIGSILNVILNLTKRWTISWTKGVNVQKQLGKFCEGVVNGKN
jgi:hypothetical protein